MLCSSTPYRKLSDKKKQDLNTDSWVCEEKIDGARVIVTSHPSDGVRFWSRFHGEDRLPIEFTDKVRLLSKGLLVAPSSMACSRSWIADGELKFQFNPLPHIDSSEGNATLLALTNCGAHTCVNFIFSGNELKLYVFDVLYDDCVKPSDPWEVRYQRIPGVLADIGAGECPRLVWGGEKEKEDFFETVLSQGGEGVLYKATDAPYTTNFQRTGWYRRKKSIF